MNIKFLLPAMATALFLLTAVGCRKDEPTVAENRSLLRKTADYKASLASEWMQLGYSIIKTNHLFGPHAARAYGYMGLAVWESVYGGIPGAKSMAGQINDYPSVAYLDTGKEFDWGLVLCSAMKTVMPELIDNTSAAQRAEIKVLADLQESQIMDEGLTETVRVNSIDLGNRTGLKILERSRRDGRDIIRNIVPVIPVRDTAHKWYWDATTFGQQPVEPMWGTVRTFVLDNSQSCESDAPFPYSEDAASPFYKEAKEVYDFYPLNDNNRRIAFHWENGPGRTSSAACHWVNIARQLVEREGKNLDEAAKAYCLVGFAAADAFSQCWYMKYKYFLMRPATFIREVIDPSWSPAIFTPPYPDFTSSAATLGGAAPVVLVPVFGDVSFVDRTHLGSPLYTPDGGPWILPERSFESLTKAGEEQAMSRMLGGINFRKACEEGRQSGVCIGNTILARLDFGI